MQFNGLTQVANAGLDHRAWVVTIVAESGDPTTVYSSALTLSPSRPYRSFLYRRDTNAPSGVAVAIEGSVNGVQWVNLFTLNDNTEQLWTSPTRMIRFRVTLPSSPTSSYTVGVVQIVEATI
ncbi:MAG: hypothetical protein RMK89_04200 [Armatimonadota bacterium]|nr:hypothetical protein [Armatimonadota bacterium]MDW8142648.1 hypothetical protein [Armatimonadota bacterium]